MRSTEVQTLEPAPKLPDVLEMYADEKEPSLQWKRGSLRDGQHLPGGKYPEMPPVPGKNAEIVETGAQKEYPGMLPVSTTADRHAHVRQILELHWQVSGVHRQYVHEMNNAFQTYIHALSSSAILPGFAGVPVVQPERAHLQAEAGNMPGPVEPAGGQRLLAPLFNRKQLEILASGKISGMLGPMFDILDTYEHRVRMPMPPFLLADRVMKMEGEPGRMGTGMIRTETDITQDTWYLNHHCMPFGMMVEAFQAVLLLSSWLGVDFITKGKRMYRLLGMDVTFFGPLPGPGETVRYDVRIDQFDDPGFMMFSYDAYVGGHCRMSMRNGRAGFFAKKEMEGAKGIRWDPETDEAKANAQMDPPKVQCRYSSFGQEQVLAFSEGNLSGCFGEEFSYGDTHVRTPGIQKGKLLLLQRVTSFQPQGGPWKRGYLCAETTLQGNEWFFGCHFKGDPVMPGNLMLEGCVQAISFYMAASGYTLDRDGWRFEPAVQDTCRLLWRGQATPASRHLKYEIFVEEAISGPVPAIYAAVLVTADGLRLFHCRRLGIRLIPDWPLSMKVPLVKEKYRDGRGYVLDGFTFNYAALLAGAWGKPSEAFGPRYIPFDGIRRPLRLPGPPYLFMSRIVRIEGDLRQKAGVVIEAEYDIPQKDWYFTANGKPAMPFCVLLEAVLQPCGWMTGLTGIPLECGEDLRCRNLDGKGSLFKEILPAGAPLRVRVKLLSVSRTGNTFVEAFDVQCTQNGQPVCTVETSFGHFTVEDMAKQVGLPISPEERQWLNASNMDLQLDDQPEAYFNGRISLPRAPLLMIGKISGYWPEDGAYGKGCVLAEREIRTGDWYFKAHFFQDPVQPGSLGIEAMIQTLQWYMLHAQLDKGMKQPAFEALAAERQFEWKYRGQVLPANKKVRILLHVKETGEDERGIYAAAEASLWVDGLKIYEVNRLAVRLIDGQPGEASSDGGEITFIDPRRDSWLWDHCPTYTLPAYPMMFMLDKIAARILKEYSGHILGAVRDVRLHRWLVCEGEQKLKTEITVQSGNRMKGTLFCWREDSNASLSRFEPIMTAEVEIREQYGQPEAFGIEELKQPRPIEDPYGQDLFFHGPGMQVVKQLFYGTNGSCAEISASRDQVPRGVLNPVLLDGLMHTVPYDELSVWTDAPMEKSFVYPHRIISAEFYAPVPCEGVVHCEVRFSGFHHENLRFPQFDFYLFQEDKNILQMRIVGISFPKGVYGEMTRKERKQFLRKEAYIEKAILSGKGEDGFFLRAETVKQQDWFAGTLEQVYALPAGQTEQDKRKWIAAKEYVAFQLKRHPAEIILEQEGERAYHPEFPLRRYHLHSEERDDAVRIKGTMERIDMSRVGRYWRERLGVADWITEDIMAGLIGQFIRDYQVEDADAFHALSRKAKPVLYFANHQTAVETVLFIYLTSALTGRPLGVIAKKEHRESTWIGKLISKSGQYPGIGNYIDIFYFDRQDQASMLHIMKELKNKMLGEGFSLLVHVEGTRALQCRKPVEKISSVFTDLAVELKLPIVPVRFAGGLPVEPLKQRTEFPYRYGTQSIHIGKPVLPEELMSFPYAERNRKVLAAVNATGLPLESEVPDPGNTAFGQKVQNRMAETSLDEPQAVILQILKELAHKSRETLQVINPHGYAASGKPDTAKVAWLEEFAYWLWNKET